jgi:hypothetical protein
VRTQMPSSGNEVQSESAINRSEDPLLTTVAGLCMGLFFLLLGVGFLGDGFHNRGKVDPAMLVVGMAFVAFGSGLVSLIAKIW